MVFQKVDTDLHPNNFANFCLNKSTFNTIPTNIMSFYLSIFRCLGSAFGHQLQKPSNKSGIVQSLGTIILFFFTKRQSQNGRTRGMAQCPSPSKKNTLLTALHLFRDMVITGEVSTAAFSAIHKLLAIF